MFDWVSGHPYVCQVDTKSTITQSMSHFSPLPLMKDAIFLCPQSNHRMLKPWFTLCNYILQLVPGESFSGNTPAQDENLVLEPSFELQRQYSFRNHILVYFPYNWPFLLSWFASLFTCTALGITVKVHRTIEPVKVLMSCVRMNTRLLWAALCHHSIFQTSSNLFVQSKTLIWHFLLIHLFQYASCLLSKLT